MSEEGKLQIEKLDGSDWVKWKWQIDMVLRAHGLDALVYGHRKPPVLSEEKTSAEVKELEKWTRDDAKAASIIACSLTRKIAELVLTCKHAHEIWEKLLARFGRCSSQRLNSLMDKFF